MIDRKTLWIFVAAFLATTGAAIWQLSLLPDWRQMPLGGPGSHNSVSGLVLFATPVSVLLFMLSPFIQWLALPKESLPSCGAGAVSGSFPRALSWPFCRSS